MALTRRTLAELGRAIAGGYSHDSLLDLKIDDEEALREELRIGDVDALIIIPEGFGDEDTVSSIRTVFDSRKPQEQGVRRSDNRRHRAPRLR